MHITNEFENKHLSIPNLFKKYHKWIGKEESENKHLSILSNTCLVISNNYTNCRGKGPRLYIGPWILSEDSDTSEEEQIDVRSSQLKPRK